MAKRPSKVIGVKGSTLPGKGTAFRHPPPTISHIRHKLVTLRFRTTIQMRHKPST